MDCRPSSSPADASLTPTSVVVGALILSSEAAVLQNELPRASGPRTAQRAWFPEVSPLIGTCLMHWPPHQTSKARFGAFTNSTTCWPESCCLME